MALTATEILLSIFLHPLKVLDHVVFISEARQGTETGKQAGCE